MNNKRHIVLIDDDPIVTSLTKRKLESYGHHVYGFQNSSLALDFIIDETNTIDLVITDNQMPQLTGIELIKKTPSHIPTILLTGFIDELSLQDLKKSSPRTIVLDKPLSMAELKEWLDQLLLSP